MDGVGVPGGIAASSRALRRVAVTGVEVDLARLPPAGRRGGMSGGAVLGTSGAVTVGRGSGSSVLGASIAGWSAVVGASTPSSAVTAAEGGSRCEGSGWEAIGLEGKSTSVVPGALASPIGVASAGEGECEPAGVPDVGEPPAGDAQPAQD